MKILEMVNIGSVYLLYLNIYAVIAFLIHIVSLIYGWGLYGHLHAINDILKF